jgi:hydroxymethylbilane synthase
MHKNTIRLIGRSSRLSILQLEIVKKKIQNSFPELVVEIIARSSRGDDLQNIPLHTVEGSDFFTQDIFDALANGEADIAVHSLKDMSGEHFFGANKFAVVDRDDVRDVAIFNSTITKKIAAGKKIIIGTCSPRREEMAIGFLKKALPQLGKEIIIETKPIRGNVETRLKKLQGDEYDGTILATAGLNRLLRDGVDASLIKSLLADKKLMLLPLIECVPAPCQGAIVAEAHFENAKAIEVLQVINNSQLANDCYNEKKEAIKYGAGCIQKFGVTTISTSNENYLYAAGTDAEGTSFIKWKPLPEATINGLLFSSTDVMKDFFAYKWSEETININTQAVFVANYKTVQNRKDILADKTVLASGTKTWFELAKQGYWVTAGADALGFEYFLPSLSMPLLNIELAEVAIITHESAAKRWQHKGYKAVSNYSLYPKENEPLQLSIAAADLIFWSSFSQFEFFGKFAKPAAKHLCAGGETAALLKQQGLNPIIFPTIKAFELWRNSFTPLHSVA